MSMRESFRTAAPGAAKSEPHGYHVRHWSEVGRGLESVVGGSSRPWRDRVHAMRSAGTIRKVCVRAAIRDHGVGEPFDDMTQDATPPRRRLRTWTENGYRYRSHGIAALTVRIDW